MTKSHLNDIRERIRAYTHAPESSCVAELNAQNPLTSEQQTAAEQAALDLVEKCRAKPEEQGLLDSFLLEYSLSNQEGVALMCLAEALLRVPDQETKDKLISEKIHSGNWGSHKGKSENLFVNAATWGMILTGGLVRVDSKIAHAPGDWVKGLVSKIGEPAVRFGVVQSMKLMGQQYVLGSKIESAIARGVKDNTKGTRFSFDMLGEGARTGAQARKYFDAYKHAIREIGKQNTHNNIEVADGISVKLTALHPRYEFAQRQKVLNELLPLVIDLAMEAKKYNIGFTVDAEEAARLDIELDIFEKLAMLPALSGWQGLGFVLQSYQKRAIHVVDWLAQLGKLSDRKLMVRLVKGAYWDAEIKHSQEMGLSDYPVFTRKVNTDLSYQICAAKLLAHEDVIYSQFATHNAYTATMIIELAGDRPFEFQRLHGMGDLLYKHLFDSIKRPLALRVYAPVGKHADLLPYLVRRLLENGANCSFVNQFLDNDIPATEIVSSVEKQLSKLDGARNSRIVVPDSIFNKREDTRVNSKGFDLDDPHTADTFINRAKACSGSQTIISSVVNGDQVASARAIEKNGADIICPADNSIQLGKWLAASEKDIAKALDSSQTYFSTWQEKGLLARADILENAADLLEAETINLTAIISVEAGRTLNDGISEVREAVDFCRYYAAQARQLADQSNMHPALAQARGVFVCISPWNFPLAIFIGQIVAALATGNTVIAKPAEQTCITAFRAIELLHKAGVPGEALHLILGEGAKVGASLVSDLRTAGVVFTGSTATAKNIQKVLAMRDAPMPPLIAETGGQNAMIVDSTALKEQVVDDAIDSAFLSAGQRCSALRVLFVQDDIADELIDMLCGAVQHLKLGKPWKLDTDVGPVIDARAQTMLRNHIKTMQKEAKFLGAVGSKVKVSDGTFVEPHIFEIDSLNVLKQEIFGPVLHIIRYQAKNIDSVIQQINDTGYGLTLGVHSRLAGFAEYIFKHTQVGNTYINRNMVGAVVGVNPFGGLGLSGTGFKAGGPHYLLRFTQLFSPTNLQDHHAIEDDRVTPNPSVSLSENIFKSAMLDSAHQSYGRWHLKPGNERAQIIDRIRVSLESDLTSAPVFGKTVNDFLLTIVEQTKACDTPFSLNGPTGESNDLSLHGRGVFCINVSEDSMTKSFMFALASIAAGNGIVLTPFNAIDLETCRSIKQLIAPHLNDATLISIDEDGDIGGLINDYRISGVASAIENSDGLAQILSDREGAIIPLINQLSIAYCLLPFCFEKTKTNNIVATGGNAFLLNLDESA